jgi:hypothetical protein
VLVSLAPSGGLHEAARFHRGIGMDGGRFARARTIARPRDADISVAAGISSHLRTNKTLTRRQLEIFNLIVRGKSNKDIARLRLILRRARSRFTLHHCLLSLASIAGPLLQWRARNFFRSHERKIATCGWRGSRGPHESLAAAATGLTMAQDIDDHGWLDQTELGGLLAHVRQVLCVHDRYRGQYQRAGCLGPWYVASPHEAGRRE